MPFMGRWDTEAWRLGAEGTAIAATGTDVAVVGAVV